MRRALLGPCSLRGLVAALSALTCAPSMCSLAGCSASVAPGRSAAVNEAFDAIVVLGHRPPLDEHGLEYETRARVERGIALYRTGRAPRLMFTGGRSTPEVVEADAMAEYAAAHGVPPDAIFRERASADTIENAHFSVSMLRARLALDRAPRVVLVTSDYHLARAVHLMRCAGADVLGEGVALQLSESERRKRERSERWVSIFYLFIAECRRASDG